MLKIDEARDILKSLDFPLSQQNDICCYTLVAMTSIRESSSWESATNNWIRIHDIIQFTEKNYHIHYAENSRETFRKQAIHHFRNAAIIEDNGKATNSPNYLYRITNEALALIQSYGCDEWESNVLVFIATHESLIDLYASKKKMTKMPVSINGKEILFSTGKHNTLQKLVLEEFAPRFAPFSECLYVGDTSEKGVFKDTVKLEQLGFSISVHEKLPDIVLYRSDKNWIYFIETVTSVGPMDAKRIIEIKKMTELVQAGKVYITAFLNLKTFKTFLNSLAWETEVWIAELPEHMIHMNGDKFIGPR
jgi:hypothetical protein